MKNLSENHYFDIKNNDELILEEYNPLKQLIQENNDLLNLWKEEIFNNSKEEISSLNENLNWINYIAENCDVNEFLNICRQNLPNLA